MKNKITYSEKNDILYPDLTLPNRKRLQAGNTGSCTLHT